MTFLETKRFLLRTDATAALRDTGAPVTDSTLENLAAAGRGPTYRIINGRAVYLRDDLEAWLREQVNGGAAKRDATKAA